MRRWDWIPLALVLLAASGSLYLLVRVASRAWGERWLALRRRPLWVQGALALALIWLALRFARLGARALFAYLATVAVLAVWGELAARDRRRAGSQSR